MNGASSGYGNSGRVTRKSNTGRGPGREIPPKSSGRSSNYGKVKETGITIENDEYGLLVKGLAEHPNGFRIHFEEAANIFADLAKWVELYQAAMDGLESGLNGMYAIGGAGANGDLRLVMRSVGSNGEVLVSDEGTPFFLSFQEAMQRYVRINHSDIVSIMRKTGKRYGRSLNRIAYARS